MDSQCSQENGFNIKYYCGSWWKWEIHSYLPAVLDYQLSGVGILCYTSVQVQSPHHVVGNWRIFFFFFDWMDDLNRSVYWACKIIIKQIGSLLFGRSFFTLLSQLPVVRLELFVLLEQKKSFLHWETQTNGGVPALWRLPNPFCFGMLLWVGEVSCLGCDHRATEGGFHFSILSFLSKCKKKTRFD